MRGAFTQKSGGKFQKMKMRFIRSKLEKTIKHETATENQEEISPHMIGEYLKQHREDEFSPHKIGEYLKQHREDEFSPHMIGEYLKQHRKNNEKERT